MRFRARIAKERLPSLWTYVQQQGGVSPECVLVLSASGLRLVALGAGETLMSYCAVSAGRALFEDFRVEAKSGSIALQLQAENLKHALKPALEEARAEVVVFKLTKRGASPYLNLDIREREAGGGSGAGAGAGGGGGGRGSNAPDVPVRVLSAAEAERFSEPNLPLPAVRLLLPSASKVQAVLERMKAVSRHVTVTGDMGYGGGGGG